MNHFKFVNWWFRFLMSRTGYRMMQRTCNRQRNFLELIRKYVYVTQWEEKHFEGVFLFYAFAFSREFCSTWIMSWYSYLNGWQARCSSHSIASSLLAFSTFFSPFSFSPVWSSPSSESESLLLKMRKRIHNTFLCVFQSGENINLLKIFPKTNYLNIFSPPPPLHFKIYPVKHFFFKF